MQEKKSNLTRRMLLAGGASLPLAASGMWTQSAAADSPPATTGSGHAGSEPVRSSPTVGPGGRQGITWPEGQALPHFASPKHLDVADIETDDVTRAEKVLFTTLQGVVNAERPRIYLLQDSEEGKQTWLQDLEVPWTEHDRWDLMRRYASHVSGVVIWDPSVEATVNIATTLAGVHRAVATSPEVAERLAAAPYHLEVVADLREQAFGSDLEAYTWQFEQLWSQTTNRMLVSVSPQDHPGFIRDYAVANQAMVFWLEVNAEDERALFERILSEVEPYTPYLGWFASDIQGEFGGTELVAAHGGYVVPADFLCNATVFAGVRTDVGGQPAPPAPELENKIYIALTMGEGDNFQYNQHKLRVLWEDPNRGALPISWTTSPLLADGAPSMLAYYQRTATENDCLVAGPSGAGYIYPGAWPDETFEVFTTKTGEYMQATGIRVIQILNRADHEDVDLTETKATRYAQDSGALGWFIHHTDHTELSAVAGVPQSVNHLVGEVQEAKDAIAQAAEGWDGNSPLFAGISPLAWNLTPTDLVEVVNGLGPEYEVVRADHFFELARKHLGL